MPGTSIVEDIELIIEDIGGGGGKGPPAGGGDGGEGGGKRRWPQSPSSRRYATAIILGILSIVMFFMAMASAFIFLRATSSRWVPFHYLVQHNDLASEQWRYGVGAAPPGDCRPPPISQTLVGSDRSRHSILAR